MKNAVPLFFIFFGSLFIFLSVVYFNWEKNAPFPKKSSFSKTTDKKLETVFDEWDRGKKDTEVEEDYRNVESQSLENVILEEWAEKQKEEEISEREKEIFIREVIEKSRQQGYEVMVTEDLKVISVKKIPKRVKKYKFKYDK